MEEVALHQGIIVNKGDAVVEAIVVATVMATLNVSWYLGSIKFKQKTSIIIIMI